MDGASSTLDSDVRAEIEVKLEGVGAARLYQGTGERVAVAVTLANVREETDVVALAGDDDSELGHLLAAELLEALLHVTDFLLEDGGVLTLRNTIANIQDPLRRLAPTDALHPVLGHEAKVLIDVGCGHHLHAVAVGVDLCAQS